MFTNKQLLCCVESWIPNSKYYGICFDRRSQNFGFHMIARSQLIADDRKRSQSIAEDRTWFYLLRSSAITIAGSQTIAEVCFHMIADDRRTFCDLRSAIRDRLRSYGNQPKFKNGSSLGRTAVFKTTFNCSHAPIKSAISTILPELDCTVCYQKTVTLTNLCK